MGGGPCQGHDLIILNYYSKTPRNKRLSDLTRSEELNVKFGVCVVLLRSIIVLLLTEQVGWRRCLVRTEISRSSN